MSEIYSSIMRPLKRPLWQVVHSLTGRRLAMTVHYHDVLFFGANFKISFKKAQDLLSTDALKIVPLVDSDFTTVTIQANEMRHVDLLYPYNELAICMPVEYQGPESAPPEPGLYYLHLPVTTEDARWPGVENFGFPKFLAEITITASPDRMSCHMQTDGQPILSLEVPVINTQFQQMQVQNYTILNGQLIRSSWSPEGEIGRCDNGADVTLTLGDHPVADELRALDMDLDAMSYSYAPQVKSVLGKPIPL